MNVGHVQTTSNFVTPFCFKFAMCKVKVPDKGKRIRPQGNTENQARQDCAKLVLGDTACVYKRTANCNRVSDQQSRNLFGLLNRLLTG